MTCGSSQVITDTDPSGLFLPFDGVLTFDATDTVRDLWAIVNDASYPNQTRWAEQVWIVPDQGNAGTVRLGSRLVNSTTGRGLDLKAGERSPMFGPLCLLKWFVVGTSGDKVACFVTVREARDAPQEISRI